MLSIPLFTVVMLQELLALGNAGRGRSLEPPAVLFAKVTARIVFITSSVEGLQLHTDNHRQKRSLEIIGGGGGKLQKQIKSPQRSSEPGQHHRTPSVTLLL